MNKLPVNLIATLFALACIDASAADPVKTACVQSGQAQVASGPRQTTAQDGTAAVSSVGNLAGGAGGGAAAASYAKVNQGLHAAGSAVAQGASASPGSVPGCDVAGTAALKEKTGASDASAGAGAGTAAAEKKVDSASTAEVDNK